MATSSTQSLTCDDQAEPEGALHPDLAIIDAYLAGWQGTPPTTYPWGALRFACADGLDDLRRAGRQRGRVRVVRS